MCFCLPVSLAGLSYANTKFVCAKGSVGYLEKGKKNYMVNDTYFISSTIAESNHYLQEVTKNYILQCNMMAECSQFSSLMLYF